MEMSTGSGQNEKIDDAEEGADVAQLDDGYEGG